MNRDRRAPVFLGIERGKEAARDIAAQGAKFVYRKEVTPKSEFQAGEVDCLLVNTTGERIQGLDINEFSRGRIDASVAELAEERDAVKELGLIP